MGVGLKETSISQSIVPSLISERFWSYAKHLVILLVTGCHQMSKDAS